LHIKDLDILYIIQKFFICGNVTTRPKLSRATFRVSNLNDINKYIIPHFQKYSLLTLKKHDFLLWAQAAELINSNNGNVNNIIIELVSLFASINRGLNTSLQSKFPNIIPKKIEINTLPDKLNPWWIAGFVAAEGHFGLGLRSSGQVSNVFGVTQHDRDINLIRIIISYFNCGNLYHRPQYSRCDFMVQNRNDIIQIIIPFFLEYPLKNNKILDFNDFKKALDARDIPNFKEEVLKIKSNINSKRVHKIK
jgi:LAGLIDADG endonuclease